MSQVAVVVLGDVGRSPRMQYHCMSLASEHSVSLIGFKGEKCVSDVEDNPRISKYLLSSPFANVNRKFFLAYAPLKILFQIFQLFWALLVGIRKPTHILVQNPPRQVVLNPPFRLIPSVVYTTYNVPFTETFCSIPTLMVVWICARMLGAKFIIDWHNFGFSILNYSGKSRWIVRIARIYEAFFARRGDAHLCVTAAMRDWLQLTWGINAVVLHDKPPPFFRRSTADEAHELFRKLHDLFPSANTAGAHQTLMTEKPAGSNAARFRADRPALLVSSTSWTEDEDFTILLSALYKLDKIITETNKSSDDTSSNKRLPQFRVAVTGKGPLKAHYEERMRQLKLSHVAIRTVWLEPADYPRLLGCADLGVCLHVSTSGLDLPMKVVDMFGAELPVCAVEYPCLSELVRDGENGKTFRNGDELADHLVHLFRGFQGKQSTPALEKLRNGVRKFQSNRWHDNWLRAAAPLFR